MSILYVCDKCGKKIKKDERYEVRVRRNGNPNYHSPIDWGEKDLCMECADKIIQRVFEPEVENTSDDVEPRWKKTNLERIRKMSADEMTDFFETDTGGCGRYCIHGPNCTGAFNCHEGIRAWLDQEVDE